MDERTGRRKQQYKKFSLNKNKISENNKTTENIAAAIRHGPRRYFLSFCFLYEIVCFSKATETTIAQTKRKSKGEIIELMFVIPVDRKISVWYTEYQTENQKGVTK